MTDNFPNDLDWQAFRYIAAEMSPAEMARFEEQLAGDQVSREAVSRATELADAVAVASAEVADSRFVQREGSGVAARTAWGRRFGWIALGAAATLAGVFLWQALPSGSPLGPTSDEGVAADMADGAAPNPNDARLALLWCQTGAEMAQAESDLWPAELPAAPLDDAEETSDPGEDTVDALVLMDGTPDQPGEAVEPEELLPSWMLAAVAGELDSVGENPDLRWEN